MTWAVIIGIVLNILGPYILKWLEDLFRLIGSRQAAMPAGDDPALFRAQMNDFFDKVEAELWWFQFRRRWAVRVARQVVMDRVEQVRQTAANKFPISHIRPLTADERDALEQALRGTS